MATRQHTEASWRDWLVPIGRIGLVLACLALLPRAAGWLGLLPAPAVGWDPELTVLEHQLRAPEGAQGAEFVLVGDSTCLAGVDAALLSRQLPGNPEVRSLALYVWLGLDVYADLLSRYAASNSRPVRTVVLLVRRGKLTDDNLERQNEPVWRDAAAQRTAVTSSTPTLRDWSGAELLRRHLLSHVLHTPLRGGGAAFYGFSSEIDAYLRAHNGSLAVFGAGVPARPSEANSPVGATELTAVTIADSRVFRNTLPPGARLVIGLTPSVLSVASPNERAERDTLLRAWAGAVGADVILTNLPPAMPDIFFSAGDHLNEAGQAVFTKTLARELEPFLE